MSRQQCRPYDRPLPGYGHASCTCRVGDHSATHAADVTLRASGDVPPAEVSIAERDRLAGRLGRAPDGSKDLVIDAADSFQEQLDALGLSDKELYEKMGSSRFLWYLIKSVIILLIAVPIALIGLAVNIWPLIGIRAINLLRVAPVVKATLKPVAGMLFFLVAWAFVLWQAFGRSLLAAGIAAVLLPVSLAALVYSSERLVRIWRVARQWVKAGRVRELQQRISEMRSAILESVHAIES